MGHSWGADGWNMACESMKGGMKWLGENGYSMTKVLDEINFYSEFENRGFDLRMMD